MSTSFIDMIVERFDKTPVIIKEIVSNKAPVVLYGAGEVASCLYLKLKEDGLNLDYVAVDDKYFINDREFFGLRIYPLSKVLEKNETCNFIIGFTDSICSKEEELKALGHRVYTFNPYLSALLSDGTERGFDFDFDFVEHHSSEFNTLYENLEDNLSRSVMSAFINQMISRDCKYLKKLWCKNQYFTEDIIKISNDEVFIDGGAFVGDTLREFIKFGKGKIYAFEPNPENFRQLLKLRKDIPNLICINKGLWVEPNTLYFKSAIATSAGSITEDATEIRVQVDSIDNVLKGDKATFIKMDIEGAELMALKGSENTIKKYKPKLAISVYHRKDDLLTIPQYIKSISDSYRLYLRSHLPYTMELVLYAI